LEDPNTDIGELLDYVTKNNPSEKNMPRGIGRFLGVLGRLDVDKRLVPNKRMKQILIQSRPKKMQLKGKGFVRNGGAVKWIKLF
jgi:hypothetical protein